MTESTIVRDPVQAALDEIRAAGLLVDQLLVDGEVHRVDVDGQKRGKRAGWYVVHLFRARDGRDLVVGSYGVWQGAENHAQRLSLRGAKLDDADRRAMHHRRAEAQKRVDAARHEQAREAAQRSREIWDKLPQLGKSPYLQRKGVRAWGTRFGRDGALVVPLRNTTGMLTGLQFIAADGTKTFITGTGKKGAFHLVGQVADEHPLVLAEGYATAATVHEATGWPVAVCFDCGNLWPVAQALRTLYPSSRFLVAGDDDHEKPPNAGRLAAVDAAQRAGAQVVFPKFADPLGRTDFNDLHQAEGLDVVRQQLLAAWTPTLAAGSDGSPWMRQLGLDRYGAMKPMEHNVILVLSHHDQWKGVFAYNQFAKRIVKRRQAPFPTGGPGWLRDVDEIETAAWFGRPDTFGAAVSTDVIRKAAVAVAERNPFHPIRSYLEGLVWDKEARIDDFFNSVCGVEISKVNAAFSRAFFLQAVARVFEPGCKGRLMLVLEGPQNKGKSTMAELLAGKEFYADIGTPPTDKDFYQAIQGVWFVEISEMASFHRAEAPYIKRAISVTVDRFRKSYGHNVEDFPRECIFFGTVNNSDWQRDETGATRFMPLWVEYVDLEQIAAMRDQLWAEAVYRLRQGERWWELPDEAAETQESRFQDDVWAQPVIRWLNGDAAQAAYASGIPAKIQTTTTSEILWRALDLDHKKHDRSAQTRIGNLMTRLRWRKGYKRTGNVRIHTYTRPPEDSA